MPTPKIPCKFSLRAKAKVQAYRKKSIYFRLRSPMKYILRFLLHQNKKGFGKHSAYRLLTRFFFWIICPQRKVPENKQQERKVVNALRNNHSNTFFLVLNRQKTWATFQRGIKCNSRFSQPLQLHKFLYSHSILNPPYVPTYHQLRSHSTQVYATPCEFPCIADYILNSQKPEFKK